MRIAIDTNVLVYAEGMDDTGRRAQARTLLAALDGHEWVLPVQVAGEFFNVLTRKLRRDAEEVTSAVETWGRFFQHHPPTLQTTLAAAFDLASRHRVPTWDAVILAAASEVGCRLLLSEDFQDGFTWHGVTVANPFAERPHPLLVDAIANAPSRPA